MASGAGRGRGGHRPDRPHLPRRPPNLPARPPSQHIPAYTPAQQHSFTAPFPSTYPTQFPPAPQTALNALSNQNSPFTFPSPYIQTPSPALNGLFNQYSPPTFPAQYPAQPFRSTPQPSRVQPAAIAQYGNPRPPQPVPGLPDKPPEPEQTPLQNVPAHSTNFQPMGNFSFPGMNASSAQRAGLMKRVLDDDIDDVSQGLERLGSAYPDASARPKRAALTSGASNVPTAPTPAQGNNLSWENIRNLVGTPKDLKWMPVVIKLADIDAGFGALSHEDKERQGIPFCWSAKLCFGKDTLDPSLSLEYSFTKQFKMTHTIRAAKENRFQFLYRTGVACTADRSQWQLDNATFRRVSPYELAQLPHTFPINDDVENTLSSKRVAQDNKVFMLDIDVCKPKTWNTGDGTDPQHFVRNLRAGRPGREVDLIERLLKDDVTRLSIYLTVPPNTGINVADLERCLDYFQKSIDCHLPPLPPYRIPRDGDTSNWVAVQIGRDFDSVEKIANGALVKNTKGTTEAENIVQLPFILEYPDVASMQIQHRLAAVREYQAQASALAPFKQVEVGIYIVKAHDLPNTELEMYFLAVDVPQLLKQKKQPPEDTLFKVHCGEDFRALRGIVRAFPVGARSTLNIRGDFLLSCTLPRDKVPPFFRGLAAADFKSVSSQNCFHALIDPVDDTTTLDRTLDAIDHVVAKDGPASAFVLPAYLGQPASGNETTDITCGPKAAAYIEGDPEKELTERGEENQRAWQLLLQTYIKHTKRDFNEEQLFALSDRPKKVIDKVIVDIGVPGSGKTTVASLKTLLAVMVGFKPLFGAKMNKVVDHFCNELEARRTELEEYLQQDRDDCDDVDDRFFLSKLLHRVKTLNFLRLLPPSLETRWLREEPGDFKYDGGKLIIGEAENLDPASDEVSINLLRACDDWHRRTLEAQTIEEKEAANETWIDSMEKMDEHNLNIEISTAKSSRYFAFPISWAMQTYITNAKDSNNQQPEARSKTKVQRKLDDLDFVKDDLETNTDPDRTAELRKAVLEAQKELMGSVVEKADFVAATCINAQHELLYNNFEPTFLILDEAENLDTATSLCLWSYDSDKVECFNTLGDTEQSDPMHVGGKVSEVAEMNNKSDLQAWKDRKFQVDYLWTQNRGHPDTMRWVSKFCYDNKIKHGRQTRNFGRTKIAKAFKEAVKEIHKPVEGLEPDFGKDRFHYLLHIDSDDQKVLEGTSRINVLEAQTALNVCNIMFKKDVAATDIAVLFCYDAQMDHFKDLVKKSQLPLDGLVLSTVDKFLGSSARIVIIATTATVNYNSGFNSLSAFLTRKSRMVVAASRAVFGVIWLGNFVKPGLDWRGLKYTRQRHWYTYLDLVLDALEENCMLNAVAPGLHEPQGVLRMAPEVQRSFADRQNAAFTYQRMSGYALPQTVAPQHSSIYRNKTKDRFSVVGDNIRKGFEREEKFVDASDGVDTRMKGAAEAAGLPTGTPHSLPPKPPVIAPTAVVLTTPNSVDTMEEDTAHEPLPVTAAEGQPSTPLEPQRRTAEEITREAAPAAPKQTKKQKVKRGPGAGVFKTGVDKNKYA